MQGDFSLWPFPCKLLGLSVKDSDWWPRTGLNQELWAPPLALLRLITMCLRAILGLPHGLLLSYALSRGVA